MNKSTMLVSPSEAAARSGLADDGAGMAWLLHTPHDERAVVDLAVLCGEEEAADFDGFVLTERGRI